MDVNFSAKQLKPGDPGFVYDKQEKFEPTEACEWDDSIIEWSSSLWNLKVSYFSIFCRILMFCSNFWLYARRFRMKIFALYGSLISFSAVEAKKDKFFYCQTCSALLQESFYKVSQVGKYTVFEKSLKRSLDPKKTINVGSSRIDPNGQMKERTKQLRLRRAFNT